MTDDGTRGDDPAREDSTELSDYREAYGELAARVLERASEATGEDAYRTAESVRSTGRLDASDVRDLQMSRYLYGWAVDAVMETAPDTEATRTGKDRGDSTE